MPPSPLKIFARNNQRMKFLFKDLAIVTRAPGHSNSDLAHPGIEVRRILYLTQITNKLMRRLLLHAAFYLVHSPRGSYSRKGNP